jgi:hypothetical protein
MEGNDVTEELAAYKLAQLPFPGVFGILYQNGRPTKNSPKRNGSKAVARKPVTPPT